MQQLIDYLSRSFPKYHEELNRYYRTETSDWRRLFTGAYDSDIFRAIFHILKVFINGDKRQLFIQFPTDKIGRVDDEQKANRLRIQESVADFLCLASKRGWEGILSCPDVDSTTVGEFYYSKDSLGYLWEIKRSERYGILPSRQGSWMKTLDARKLFNESRRKCVRLSLTSTAEIPRRIDEWVDRVNLYRELPEVCSATKCILVGANQSWKCQPINTGVFESPITFVSDFARVSNQECDVLVLLWEKKYLTYWRDISNAVMEGRIKKVVYLGTEIFEEFKDDPSHLFFPFTYRELYAYFNDGLGKLPFPRFEFRKVPFPSLEKKVSELEHVIPQRLDDSDKRRIIRFSLYPFLCLHYSVLQIDRLRRYLWDNFQAMSPDEIDAVIEWVSTVSFSGRSPKEKEDYSIITKKNKFYISPLESYKDRLNSSLKTSNSNKQVYVIDALVNDRRYVDIVKSLLERGCRGSVYILSYFDLPYLKNFFEEEVRIYTGNDRAAFTSVAFDRIAVTPSSTPTSLLDFYDGSADDLSQVFAPQQPVSHQTFICSFKNIDEKSIVDGDVIYQSGTKTIDEIYSNQEEYLPCVITYYRKPEDFQHLMEVYFDFPQGENVEFFSRLWKLRMQELLKNHYDGNVERMWVDFRFMRLDKLKKIVRNRYFPLFPDEIRQIVLALKKADVISDDEVKFIRSSNAVVAQHSTKAKELKNALIQYKLTGTVDAFLQQLIMHGAAHGEEWTAELLANRIMITQTLVAIIQNTQ